MTCEPCARAQTVRHHEYDGGCKGCSARALAASPAFFDSETDARMTRTYKTALLSIFGAEWEAGHDRVKAEAERMRAMA